MSECFSREEIVAARTATCRGRPIKILKYNDSSMWIACPNFGWFGHLRQCLGCKEKKRRCTWFFG